MIFDGLKKSDPHWLTDQELVEVFSRYNETMNPSQEEIKFMIDCYYEIANRYCLFVRAAGGNIVEPL